MFLLPSKQVTRQVTITTRMCSIQTKSLLNRDLIPKLNGSFPSLLLTKLLNWSREVIIDTSKSVINVMYQRTWLFRIYQRSMLYINCFRISRRLRRISSQSTHTHTSYKCMFLLLNIIQNNLRRLCNFLSHLIGSKRN